MIVTEEQEMASLAVVTFDLENEANYNAAYRLLREQFGLVRRWKEKRLPSTTVIGNVDSPSPANLCSQIYIALVHENIEPSRMVVALGGRCAVRDWT
jgi:hypothetical protein